MMPCRRTEASAGVAAARRPDLGLRLGKKQNGQKAYALWPEKNLAHVGLEVKSLWHGRPARDWGLAIFRERRRPRRHLSCPPTS